MICFDTDYQEGCHPRILERLMETNMEQTSGYGVDPHCERARELIRQAVGVAEAEVYFLVGGTQTNTILIKAFLSPCEGVVCADSGHINVHEAGAIEATGHKVIPLPSREGLLDAEILRERMEAFRADPTNEHTVQPGMVYISYASECGTLYTFRQLEALYAVCREYGLRLYIDGARLGCGMTAQGADVTLEKITRVCDAFSIGGTKGGALFGEALVLPRPGLVKHFRTLIKQQGGLLAKGRLLGIQFEVLFEEEEGVPLYLALARHANWQAMRLRKAFEAKGIPLLYNSMTNQQFPILTEEQNRRLTEKFAFEPRKKMPDGNLAVRFCTSWATKPEDVTALIGAIQAL